MRFLLPFVLAAICAAEPLRVAYFEADVTPPLGAPLCYGLVEPARQIVDPLTARGVIVYGSGKPIVLAAVDWLGIANESHDAWRAAIAQAANTSPERVSVHVLHQHDAPGVDVSSERLAEAAGLKGRIHDPISTQQALQRVAAAVAAAKPSPFTHIGIGKAKVERVASNRRILGPDGQVKYRRMSSSRDPEAVAAPEGLIDPYVRVLSFWDRAKPLISISYYATHPQSHYGKGGVSWEFVGMARAEREKAAPQAKHIHFNGAGGNVAAGKYNDGSPERRPELAARLADGMRRAWEATARHPVSSRDVEWRFEPVRLPATRAEAPESLRARLNDPSQPERRRTTAARHLAFQLLSQQGRSLNVNLLRIGPAQILHLPGELFVEYQVAANAMAKKGEVMMAAYGDLGPGYIGTRIAYTQGGYETSEVSRTAPEVEDVLMTAMRKLLQ